MYKDIKNLDSYIQACIDDAMMAANSQDPSPKYWYMLIGNDLLFHMQETSGNYSRDPVTRRVLYRLNANLQKNFGLRFFAPILGKFYLDDYLYLYELAEANYFNWHHAITEVSIFGVPYVVSSHDDMCIFIGEDKYDTLLQGLAGNGFDIHDYSSFATYFQAFTKTCGFTPMQLWLSIQNTDDGLPDVSGGALTATANDDMKKHGCYYYSVCTSACGECKKADNPCRREKPVMRDALALSKYRMMREGKLLKEAEGFRKIESGYPRMSMMPR